MATQDLMLRLVFHCIIILITDRKVTDRRNNMKCIQVGQSPSLHLSNMLENVRTIVERNGFRFSNKFKNSNIQ